MKAERAAAHLKTLQTYLRAFAAKPYTVLEKDDEERQLYIVRIRLNGMEDVLPISVGEYTHSLIKTLQPYTRGNTYKTHPLWQLNKLSNLDKHEVIGYSGTTVQFRFIRFDGLPDPPWRNLEDSPEVEVLIPFSRKDKVKIEYLTPDFIFGRPMDSPGSVFELSEADIAEIHRFVTVEVLPKFGRFFDRPVTPN